MVVGQVSLDNILFISQLMAEIALWTENCLSECDFGLSYRYYKLIEPAKEGFVEEEMYSSAHFPVILIIQDLRLRIV